MNIPFKLQWYINDYIISLLADLPQYCFPGDTITVDANPNLNYDIQNSYILSVDISDGNLTSNGDFIVEITNEDRAPILDVLVPGMYKRFLLIFFLICTIKLKLEMIL